MSWLFIEWNFFGCFNPLIVRPMVSGLFGTSYIKRLNQYVALLLLLFWQKCCSISIFFSQVICIITIKKNLSRKVRNSHQKVFLKMCSLLQTDIEKFIGCLVLEKQLLEQEFFALSINFSSENRPIPQHSSVCFT